MTSYNREIKLHEDYPVTVLDAVYVGDGTSTTLKQYIKNQIRDKETNNAKKNKLCKFNFESLIDAINLNTNVTKTYEVISEPFGSLQFVGGICVNKKIYLAPNTADFILVYDIDNEYYYKIGLGLGTQPFKYTGWVYYDGFIYAIPRGVNNLLKVNPITDEVFIIELDTNYPITPYGDYRDSHHYNGVISDDGYMYLPPAYSSNKLLKINMSDFSFEELDFTSEHVNTWIGCVKHPIENKIIFLSTYVFRIWNCEDDTYIDIYNGEKRSCYDLVFDARYNCFYGCNYDNGVSSIFALSIESNSVVASKIYNYGTTGYGITLGLDGCIYHIEGKNVFNFTFDGTTFTQNATISTTDSVGDSTPCHAGQCIDNYGNIYGIPASGAFTKLKFTGVNRKLSDYIVSSQYYGKY